MTTSRRSLLSAAGAALTAATCGTATSVVAGQQDAADAEFLRKLELALPDEVVWIHRVVDHDDMSADEQRIIGCETALFRTTHSDTGALHFTMLLLLSARSSFERRFGRLPHEYWFRQIHYRWLSRGDVVGRNLMLFYDRSAALPDVPDTKDFCFDQRPSFEKCQRLFANRERDLAKIAATGKPIVDFAPQTRRRS